MCEECEVRNKCVCAFVCVCMDMECPLLVFGKPCSSSMWSVQRNHEISVKGGCAVEAPAWLRAWAGIKMEAKEGLLDNSVRDGETDGERERERDGMGLNREANISVIICSQINSPAAF